MMQSLLLTGVTSAKNSDVKAHKESEHLDEIKKSGSVKEEKKFATVMKESLDKEDQKTNKSTKNGNSASDNIKNLVDDVEKNKNTQNQVKTVDVPTEALFSKGGEHIVENVEPESSAEAVLVVASGNNSQVVDTALKNLEPGELLISSDNSLLKNASKIASDSASSDFFITSNTTDKSSTDNGVSNTIDGVALNTSQSEITSDGINGKLNLVDVKPLSMDEIENIVDTKASSMDEVKSLPTDEKINVIDAKNIDTKSIDLNAIDLNAIDGKLNPTEVKAGAIDEKSAPMSNTIDDIDNKENAAVIDTDSTKENTHRIEPKEKLTSENIQLVDEDSTRLKDEEANNRADFFGTNIDTNIGTNIDVVDKNTHLDLNLVDANITLLNEQANTTEKKVESTESEVNIVGIDAKLAALAESEISLASQKVKSIDSQSPLTEIKAAVAEHKSNTVETNVKLEDEVSDSKQNYLLSQIEAAQQVDVGLKNKKSDVSDRFISGTANDIASLDAKTTKSSKETVLDSFVTSNENNKLNSLSTTEKKGVEKESLINATASNTSDSEDDEPKKINTPSSAALLAEQSERLPSTLRSESLAINQPVIDVNGAKPNQTSLAQLDKFIAANQQAQTSNNLLQQPLDLHSKHAATMMGERVMMMISQGKQEVNIRLDPAELGSMFIKVHVQQDQVQLNIQTQVGLSKEIIEQNMPRLREQLAQQGIQLGEANVQQQSQQQSQQQRNTATNTTSGQVAKHGDGMGEDGQESAWIPSKIPSRDQGIDYYA